MQKFILCSLGAFLVGGVLAGAPAPVAAQSVATFPREITATNGAAGDSFGYSVSLHGHIAVVSAPAATIGANVAQGAVYVFRYRHGAWTQMAQLTANDGAAYDNFGNSVACDGTTLIVGAPDAAVNGNAGQGAAYIFNETNGVWTQTQKLLATDGAFGNEFGTSVALQGGTALIGAIQLLHGPGAAYVFNNSGGLWSQTQKLIAAEGSATFGDAVALDGANALMGAQQTNVGGLFDEGAAFVFTNENGTWNEKAVLVANDGTFFDSLGGSVALAGTTALVGASGASIHGQQIGAAYIFTENDGTWSKAQRLTASDAHEGDGFGSAVSLSGNMALVGADQYASDGPGKVYLFTQTGDTWTQTSELEAPNGTHSAELGWSAALDQKTILAGAWGATVNGQAGQGAVYIAR